MHCEVEGRVVPLDGLEEGSYSDLSVEFFADFSCEGCFRGFSGLDFSARKFPPTLPLAVSSLGRKNLIVFDYYRCDNFYRFNAF